MLFGFPIADRGLLKQRVPQGVELESVSINWIDGSNPNVLPIGGAAKL